MDAGRELIFSLGVFYSLQVYSVVARQRLATRARSFIRSRL